MPTFMLPMDSLPEKMPTGQVTFDVNLIGGDDDASSSCSSAVTQGRQLTALYSDSGRGKPVAFGGEILRLENRIASLKAKRTATNRQCDAMTKTAAQLHQIILNQQDSYARASTEITQLQERAVQPDAEFSKINSALHMAIERSQWDEGERSRSSNLRHITNSWKDVCQQPASFENIRRLL